MESYKKYTIPFLLILGMLFVLTGCGKGANTPKETTTPPASGVLGSIAPTGTHNEKPFYIGYLSEFGSTLSAFQALDLTEDSAAAADEKQIAVYVPGGSARTAVVNIAYDETSDSFIPLQNLGWAALGADRYILFTANLPADTPKLAVVIYGDGLETQQAFALKKASNGALVLVPILLAE
ncbi:hypothetical protein LJC20_06215 [Eubacteriales bacterium OttesenSCG-928-M02]|nr:hypothetical protein [Eubacteriales bacterium OttesenSCG-928-M02]